MTEQKQQNSFHLFLTSSASIRSLLFLSFIVPILIWKCPLVSPIFLKRSLVFPILSFSSMFLHCLLKKAFLSLLAILCNSAFRWVYLSLSFDFHFFSLLAILWNSAFSWVFFPFSLDFGFSSFLSYLYSLLRQPLCLLAFLFH